MAFSFTADFQTLKTPTYNFSKNSTVSPAQISMTLDLNINS